VTVELKVNSELAHWHLEIRLSNMFRQPPGQIVMRIPWFYEVEKIEIDGLMTETGSEEVILSANSKEVKIGGRIRPGTPEISFEQTVDSYKREYRRRYQEFLRTGVVLAGDP
jgi:hypothetical protein